MNVPPPVDILLVEDDPADAELTLRSLKRRNLANNIVWVKDGQEALDYVFHTGEFADRNGGNPKLVLLDLKLPKFDGLEVLRRIKADPKTRSIPVVVLTSSKQERDVVESYELGVNSFIQKPVDFVQFSEAIGEVGLYWLVYNEPPLPKA